VHVDPERSATSTRRSRYVDFLTGAVLRSNARSTGGTAEKDRAEREGVRHHHRCFHPSDPVLNDTGYITGGGADTRVQLGAFLEIVPAIAGIATAVVLFPIVKRQSESIALGYVATRVLESTIIVVGLISLLAVVTLRQDLAGVAGSDPAALDTVGRRSWPSKTGRSCSGPPSARGSGTACCSAT
jgi:uncharacterized protein DUF4386